MEADSKSLAGRAKGTSLTQDRDGTGLGRGQKERMEEQGVHSGWQVAHLYGEELREVCGAFLAARPALDRQQDTTGWSGVGNPAGHRVTPCSCSPSSCPTHLQGIVEDGDTRVIQAGI